MTWVEWVVLPLIGALGGFLAGMLGVGGGIIFIPVLTYLFEKNGLPNSEIVKYTLANSIFLVFISGVSGAVRQHIKKTLNWNTMLLIGIPGALIALMWSFFIQWGAWYKKENFQIVFLLFLVISILNMLFMRNQKEKTVLQNKNTIPVIKAVILGMTTGTVVALSGLGGGIIMVPMFRIVLNMPIHKATILSLSIIPLLSIAPLLSYMGSKAAEPLAHSHSGYIVWPYILPIAAMVVIFANIGMRSAKLIPDKVLRFIFAALSLTILIKTLFEICKF